jgi:hypothetical protein
MFFIFNVESISQAGRRGFDPRLPLQPQLTAFFVFLTVPYLSQKPG